MNQILSLEHGGVSLVFGLEWFALLESAPLRAARRLARSHRASHMVLLDAFPGAVGLADLPQNRALRRMRRNASSDSCRTDTQMHSAAQLFAHLYPAGTVAMLLEIKPDVQWLIAVHEGVVIARTDRLYDESDAANAALAELQIAYPHLLVLGSTGAPPYPSLDMLSQHASEASLLTPYSRWRGMLLPSVFGLALLLAALLGLPIAWMAQTSQLTTQSSPLNMLTTSVQSAVQVSDLSLVHGNDGLSALIQVFLSLPVKAGGWSLRVSQCDASFSQWACHAFYRRSHPHASNKSFLRHVQDEWHVSFPSMDEARIDWKIRALGDSLGDLRPMPSAYNDHHLLSTLQAIRPGFTHLQVNAPQAVHLHGASSPTALSRPLRTEDNAPNLIEPEGAHSDVRYVSRALSISGPLRSASLLIGHASFMGWSRAVLDYRPQDMPDIRRSSLNLLLEGKLYEIAQLHPAQARADVGGSLRPPLHNVDVWQDRSHASR